MRRKHVQILSEANQTPNILTWHMLMKHDKNQSEIRNQMHIHNS
jgi:hypothetical protein